MVIIHSLYREPTTIGIDDNLCKRCARCSDICPTDILQFADRRVHVNENSPFGCIACGHCMMVCPEGAVTVTGRGLTPDDLMPMPLPEQKANGDALESLMRSRRSIRRFKEKEIEQEKLERILEMASSAPMGIPPWDIGCVIVKGRPKVQELAADIVKDYDGFLKIMKPWVVDLMRPFMKKSSHEMFKNFIVPLGKLYVEHRKEGRDMLFYDAPAVMLFHHSPYAESTDAAIACTYAMLAAESMGIGNTIIGGAPPILQRNKQLCKKWGIPDGNRPSISLILGYPNVQFEKTVMRRFTSVKTIQS